MRYLLGIIVMGALSCLAFPGHYETAYAQGVAVAQPAVSTNPEIAALQARNAIFEKQLSIINQKLDKLLNAPATPAPETVAPPRAEPSQPGSVPAPTAPVPLLRSDGTILFNGTVYAPLLNTTAYGPSSVSLTADACAALQSVAACSSSTSAGVSVGVQRPGLFGGGTRRAARRAARSGGAGAGGC
jgi:hypothetical protein